MTHARSILHVDMDAFFASVEQLDHPEWRGKPVLVAHDGPRGVVAAASYEARKFGCHSAQPTAVARRLCPSAIIAPGRFGRYREISHQVFAIFDRYTPDIEPLSVDEAFLDVTQSVPLFGPPEVIAGNIRREIHETTGLTASVGVAPNKFLAKLASDMNKPDGLTILNQENIGTILPPLPIEKMWGIGPKTAGKLHAIGVRTFGDLLRSSPESLRLRVGTDAEHWIRLARGEDDRIVTSDRVAKSIGQEQTFGQDLVDPEAVRAVLLEECEQVATRLRKHRLFARSITVKIRYGDFQTITRQCTLNHETNITQTIWQAARDLFNAWAEQGFHPVRLIGVQSSHFSQGQQQQELFQDGSELKQKKLDQAIDQINRRFGKGVVKRRLT